MCRRLQTVGAAMAPVLSKDAPDIEVPTRRRLARGGWGAGWSQPQASVGAAPASGIRGKLCLGWRSAGEAEDRGARAPRGQAGQVEDFP